MSIPEESYGYVERREGGGGMRIISQAVHFFKEGRERVISHTFVHAHDHGLALLYVVGLKRFVYIGWTCV